MNYRNPDSYAHDGQVDGKHNNAPVFRNIDKEDFWAEGSQNSALLLQGGSDDYLVSNDFYEACRSIYCFCELARDINEAIKCIASTYFSIIFVSHTNANIYETIKSIRGVTNAPILVCCSTQNSDTHYASVLEVGADGIISLPCSSRYIAAICQSHVRRFTELNKTERPSFTILFDYITPAVKYRASHRLA